MSHITRRGALLAAAVATLAGAGAAYASGAASFVLGPSSSSPMRTWQGYYDAHKDTYLITDVSDKAQSSAWHVNYSAALKSVKGVPLQYFVVGAHASGQLTVFGSEPGESDYNPLWLEVVVTFKNGTTPVLLGSDNQINSLVKAGKLTAKPNGIILNAPITKVG
jgi:hypothetical protein